jgi:hypothetical protein
MSSPDRIPAAQMGAAMETTASSSRNAANFSSASATRRFLLSRCASAIQIVRPLESIAETQPQLNPALIRLSPMIYFCPSIVRFRRRIEMKCFCTGDIGRLFLMERAE